MLRPPTRAAIMLVLFLAPVFAQTSTQAAVTQQPGAQTSTQAATTQQQAGDDVLIELRSIRQLLERLVASSPVQPSVPQPVQPVRARVPNLNGYALGRVDAPLTMVEFSDLQCPFCRQYANTTFDDIRKNWIDTGKLRYLTRDFPLSFHTQAMRAARAARCAGEQGQYWPVRLALMKNGNALTPEYIKQTANERVADRTAFSTCLDGDRYASDIRAEELDGLKLGVAGTPTFVIGRTKTESIEGPMLVGAVPYATLDAALTALLDASK